VNAGTKILLLLLLIALAVIAGFIVFIIPEIVALVLLSMLFSFIMAPGVNALESEGVPRFVAASVVFVLFFGGVGLAIYNLAPIIYEQILRLQQQIGLGEVQNSAREMERWLASYLSYVGVEKVSFATRMEEWIGSVLDNALNIASSVLGLLVFFAMMLISTFFMIKDGKRLKKQIIAIVPNQFFEMTLSIMHKIDWSLGAYLRGILLDSFIIGTLTTLAMWIIGVENFVLIGLIAGIANLVPYLGPPTAMVVASIISYLTTGSPSQILLIFIVFELIRLFDNAVIQPMAISSTVKLHPLIIIFAILIGGQLFGLLGMLFAVPVVGVLKVVFSELYIGTQRYRPASLPPTTSL
jgi:predicted PurR-regulated permease PerM